eukprot:350463-Chlamydomonas_euryale.AAC.5
MLAHHVCNWCASKPYDAPAAGDVVRQCTAARARLWHLGRQLMLAACAHNNTVRAWHKQRPCAPCVGSAGVADINSATALLNSYGRNGCGRALAVCAGRGRSTKCHRFVALRRCDVWQEAVCPEIHFASGANP